jgi:hypothetical protein
MLKIGNYIINENAIAYINLNAKKTKIDYQEIDGVRIHFLAPNHTDYTSGNCGTVPDSLFFTGIDAQALREYFRLSSILDLNTFVN